MSRYNARIVETGNGLPGERDMPAYVAGEGLLWRVLRVGRVETGRAPGAGDWCLAEVEDADWDDCPEGEEFPARVETGREPGDES